MALLVGVFFLSFIQASLGVVSIDIAPFNTTGGIGQSTTLACSVSGKTSETVKWKKVDGTPLTVDQTIVGSVSKYSVGTYNLTIASLARSDESGYTCEISSSSSTTIIKTAYLTVVDLPNNLSVYWSSPAVPGTVANLTCKARHVNPAPEFAWYKNEVLQTTTAIIYTTSSSSGYVDAYSVLPARLTIADNAATFRCQLEYTGWPRAMEVSLDTVLTSGSYQLVMNIAWLLVGTTLALTS